MWLLSSSVTPTGPNTRRDTTGSLLRLTTWESPSRSSTDAAVDRATSSYSAESWSSPVAWAMQPLTPPWEHAVWFLPACAVQLCGWELNPEHPRPLPTTATLRSLCPCWAPSPWIFMGLDPSHRSCFSLNVYPCKAAAEHPVHSSPFHPPTSSLLSITLFYLLHNLLNIWIWVSFWLPHSDVSSGRAETFSVLYPLYSSCLEECLAWSRHSIKICWMKQWSWDLTQVCVMQRPNA